MIGLIFMYQTHYQSVWCQIDAHDLLGTTMLSIMVIDGNY